MKTNSLLVVLFVTLLGAFTISSCSGDKYWQDPRQEGSTELLTVGIPFSRQALRTPQVDPAIQVNSVLFVFLDGDTPSSAIVKVIESSNPDEISAGKFHLRLKKDKYFLLAVANPNEKMKNLLVPGTTLEELSTPYYKPFFYTRTLKEGTNRVKSIFPIAMLNAQGLVAVKEDHFGEAPSSPLSVELELAFARIIVTGYPTFGPSMKDLLGKYAIYTVKNTLKEYLMRHMAILSSGQEEQQGDGSTARERYAYSPLYKEIEAATTPESLRPFLTSNIFDQKSTLLPFEENWLSKDADINAKRNYPGAYRLEHTISSKNLITALTPHLVLVYKLCPKSLSPAEGEGWISYQKHYFMLESDFRNVLLAQKNGTAINVVAAQKFPSSFFVASQKLLAKAGNDPAKVLNKAFTEEDIRFYKNSYNFFFFPIRHFDDTQAPQRDSYGRYGIVRGNEYQFKAPLKINEFGATGEQEITNDLTPLKEYKTLEGVIRINPLHARTEQELSY